MKKIVILYKNQSPILDAIKYYLSDHEVECLTTPSGMDRFDLVVNLDVEYSGEALACHHSLLPAFDSKEPVKDAILAGVKLTGITIYYTKSKKIVAQYPVFINNETHYDDLKQELAYIEQALFPLVIQKILKNEAFEVRALLKSGCGNSCRGVNSDKCIGGCSGCSH